MNHVIFEVVLCVDGLSPSEVLSKAQGLADRVAVEILKVLRLPDISTALAFSICISDNNILLEINTDSLSMVLHDKSIINSYADVQLSVDAACSITLGCLELPMSSTRFGRLVLKNLSITKDYYLDVKINGRLVSLEFPKIAPPVESDVYEKGLYMIDSIFKSKAICHLICCKSQQQIIGTFDFSSDVKRCLEKGAREFPYVALSGVSVCVGGRRKKGSFVIKSCDEFFSEIEYSQIASSDQFDGYFSINERSIEPLNLLLD